MVTLVQLLVYPPNVEIQVEVASTLGCVVLSNTVNQERLKEHPDFQFEILLDLLKLPDKVCFLETGFYKDFCIKCSLIPLKNSHACSIKGPTQLPGEHTAELQFVISDTGYTNKDIIC
jgi:hypothetical protein